MGRLHRYIQRLSDAEWHAIHEAAMQHLGRNTLSLLCRLRAEKYPPKLTRGQKEVTKHIERWLWKWLYVESHRRHSHREKLPTEWIVSGAGSYYQRGMIEEALAILRRHDTQNAGKRVNLLLLRILWETENLRFRSAQQTLYVLEKWLGMLLDSTRRQRLQITLQRLLSEHGGSYTAVALRVLTRLSNLEYWHRSLPENIQDRAAEINLRMLYAQTRGDIKMSIHLYETHADALRGQTLNQAHDLNGWLAYLMAGMPFEKIQTLLKKLSPPGNIQDMILMFNRLLLTLVSHASPAHIRRLLPLLRQTYQASDIHPVESRLAWSEVLWMGGEVEEAFAQLEHLRGHKSLSIVQRVQINIMAVILTLEEQRWTPMYRNLQRTFRVLRTARACMASATLLHRQIRLLYNARLRSAAFQRAARAWQVHIQAYPAEALQWRLTLLPVWIEARAAGISLRDYIAMHRTAAIEPGIQCILALLFGT